METNLNLKQIIHPNYFLSSEELKMVEEYYDDRREKGDKYTRRAKRAREIQSFSIRRPIKKLVLSACAVVLSATTIPFLFVTSEAKTDFDFSKVEKMQNIIPDLQQKYEEVSKDLTGLTGVVTYLVESEVKRTETPTVKDGPQISVKETDAPAVRVATVIKDKTPLKLEKNISSKTIIFVGKDSKLAVQGEEDNWLLVSSPKGGRAWIEKNYIK